MSARCYGAVAAVLMVGLSATAVAGTDHWLYVADYNGDAYYRFDASGLVGVEAPGKNQDGTGNSGALFTDVWGNRDTADTNFFDGPYGIAQGPDYNGDEREDVYVTSLGGGGLYNGDLAVLDGVTGQLIEKVADDGNARFVRSSGPFVYVTDYSGSDLGRYTATNGNWLNAYAVVYHPIGIGLDEAGNRAFLAQYQGTPPKGSLINRFTGQRDNSAGIRGC